MTDLDRKIAELKGLTYEEDRGHIQIFDKDESLIHDNWGIYGLERSWSTDTAKAFELVDEVGGEFKLEGSPDHWSAVFDVYGQHHQEIGDSREEAICRAYIALKEWEGKR